MCSIHVGNSEIIFVSDCINIICKTIFISVINELISCTCTSYSFHYYHMLLLHYSYAHSGGVKVMFAGSYLNVTRSPMIIITDTRFTSSPV